MPCTDKRQWFRYPSGLPTQYEVVAEPAIPRLRARIHDVSPGGIRLEVEDKFEPGSLLHIAMPKRTGKNATEMLSCVIHVVTIKEDHYTLGCSFIRELTPEELEAFL